MTDSQTLWKLLAFKDQSAFNYANKLCMSIRLLEKTLLALFLIQCF